MSDFDGEDIQALYGEFLDETKELLHSFNEELVKFENEPENTDRIKRIFRIAHTLKGNAGFIGLTPLQELSHRMENVLGKLRDGQIQFVAEINDVFFEGLDLCRRIVADFVDDKLGNVDIDPVLAKLDTLEAGGAIAPAGKPAAAAPSPAVPAPKAQQPAAAPVKESEEVERRSAQDEVQYMRVSAQRLDRLVNLVGELVAGRSRLLQLKREIPNKSFEEVVSFISNVAGELQSEVLGIRMVPIKQLFNRFYRPVRDTARSKGKDINLAVQGENTELDKTIIEAIYDPLMHLVRNSIGHGIETPSERIAAGKEPRGTLSLRAYHEQNSIFIEVVDDGRGFNVERIRQRAIERGMVSVDEARQISEKEAADLVFLPGFSTAREIDDISGRGVGLDVVKTNIERLGGVVSVSWIEGQGTKFTLRLPLTLAIMEIFLIEVDGQLYGIPLHYIEETIRIRPSAIEKIKGQLVYLLRHRPVTITSLRELFGKPAKEDQLDFLPVIVLRVFNRRIGVIVDRLIGKEETVLKSLGPYVDRLAGTDGNWIAGASILGSGEVVLILDVPTLFRSLSTAQIGVSGMTEGL
ncbi:MAG: chemotaxis protein CheA [Chrysiogenetes bacterium]|nr:chemotaxis protein CheA [Chrysiogenetes bacterium]